MKKILACLLALALLLTASATLTACGGKNDDTTNTTVATTEQQMPSNPPTGTLREGDFYSFYVPEGFVALFESETTTTYYKGSNGLSFELKSAAAKDGAIDTAWKDELNPAWLSLHHNSGGTTGIQIRSFASKELVADRIFKVEYTLYNPSADKTTYGTIISIRSNPDTNNNIQYVRISVLETNSDFTYGRTVNPAIK